MTVLVSLDANALDFRGAEGVARVERFHAARHAGCFGVVVTRGVVDEIAHPRTPAGTHLAFLSSARQEVDGPRVVTHAQKLDRIRVRAILRGDTDGDKHDADATHLAEAAEAGCAYFITHDKRILRRRDDLRRVLVALQIVTLERFVAILDDEERDEGEEDRGWF